MLLLDEVLKDKINKSKNQKVNNNPNDYYKDDILYCGNCNKPKEVFIELINKKIPCICECENKKMLLEEENERKQNHYIFDIKYIDKEFQNIYFKDVENLEQYYLFAKKFVIFINNTDSSYSSNLTNILLEEIYYLKKITNNKDKLNIILDDFDELEPIKDFAKILNNSRYMGIRFLCTIKSYTNLNYNYGAYSEIIKMCFANIIYLRSNDLTTMEEISRLCGEYMKNEPLISVEELKRLKVFEAIVLLPRRLPYKAKLLPDYKINWGYETKESEYKERELKDIKIYHQN